MMAPRFIKLTKLEKKRTCLNHEAPGFQCFPGFIDKMGNIEMFDGCDKSQFSKWYLCIVMQADF